MSKNNNVTRSEKDCASTEDLLVMHITTSNEKKILYQRFLIQLIWKMLSLHQMKMMNSVRKTHISSCLS